MDFLFLLPMAMEELPAPILIDILSRLSECSDLARCRVVSKTLNSLSFHVSSLRFLSTSRGIKSIVTRQLSLLRPSALRSLSLSSAASDEEDEDEEGAGEYDEGDDRHLTDVGFMSQWLPRIAPNLTSLAVVDFWAQSCWRASTVLELITSCCKRLVNLELRYAWLSMEGVKPLPSLKSLTLEFIRLEDEDLSEINQCFPFLEDLNLIGVGGLTVPSIHLLHLKTCYWTVSNVPFSLSITAPILTDLRLKCVEPNSVVLRTPLLSSLALIIEKQAVTIDVERLMNLRSLKIQTYSIQNVVQVFIGCTTVRNLEIEAPMQPLLDMRPKCIGFEDLMRSFPNLSYLKLSLGAWSQFVSSLRGGTAVPVKWDSLTKLTVQLPDFESDASLSFVLDACPALCEVVFLVAEDTLSDIRIRFISRIAKIHPNVKWRREILKQLP